MAGPASQPPPPNAARDPSPRPALPSGPCNHGDAAAGQCGCDRFWDTLSAELHEASAEHRPSSDRSTWCVCGHHACFHLRAPPPLHQPPAHDARAKTSQASTSPPSRQAPSQAGTSALPGIPSVCMLSRDQPAAAGPEPSHDETPSRQAPSQASTSALPGIPSVCMLSRDQPSHDDTPSRQAMAGLGLSMMHVESNDMHACSRNLQLDVVGDTIPNTYNPDDYIQSATEVATPSIANTPDLGAADQAVQESKSLVDTLSRLTSTAPQEQLPHVLRPASPQALQKLISYLAPLHNLLNSIPNVANTMRELAARLDVLESGSFNFVQPDDLNQTLSMYDDRLIDLETRMDDHDKHHQAIEADQDSSSSTRRRIENVSGSFGSNHSLPSTTSSALILAAMDRKDADLELGNIKDRLDILEYAALPTTFQPWELEVVLIPWGRDLRGIWFAPDEPMHDTARTTTQDSEEWTQAHSSKRQPIERSTRELDSSPYHGPQNLASSSMGGDNESGWSSQAISEWASGSIDDWLFPKACGSNNLVYKRLQSRGFIRNVTLKGASARDLQATLSHVFTDLLEHLSYTHQDGDSLVAAYPGLRASFVPLRKVHKESKLRFLSPAEMSSSALWSAQFLSAGVIMRVSGGKKRLYVTQREAYIQHSDDLGSTWTWQELRQLPRYQPEQDSQMQGNDEHCQSKVPEADAKETCWQYVEAYDAPPPSVHSSFGSHQSVELSMRPADRQWRRSITPSSILKNKMPQPISPLSEFHPRPGHFRQRTISASIVEPLPSGSSKRRFHSSPVKQSSAPQPTSRTPSVSVARLKRRRTANPSSRHQEDCAYAEAQSNMWNPTPRRSREPPSPFYSSQPALPRTNSDVASRPSQRSVAVLGKSTPFGYATPHSGPFLAGAGFARYNNGGDTEPDDDDVYEDDDGEQSWRGVTDGDDEAATSSSSSGQGAEEGLQYGASFSGDESGFGTESEDEDGEQSEFDIDRNAPNNTTTDEDEEEGDVLDTLLGVLEH